MTDEELTDALAGLFAYDTGSVDSGIHDEALKERCFEQLRQYGLQEGLRLAPPNDAIVLDRLTVFLTRMLGERISEEALAQGYSIEDAMEFVHWLEDETGMSFR
jgi:hypothetical protein